MTFWLGADGLGRGACLVVAFAETGLLWAGLAPCLVAGAVTLLRAFDCPGPGFWETCREAGLEKAISSQSET